MSRSLMNYLPRVLREKLEGRDALQRAIGNTGWLFGENVFRMAVGFVIGVWLARYLGPEQYGLLSYALAFVTLFAPLATLGLDDIVVRNLVQDPSCKEETLGSAFVLRVIGGALSVLAAIAAIFVLRPNDALAQYLVAIIAASSVFQAFNITECWFNSQVQSKYIVFARSSSFIVCSIAKVVLLINGASLTAIAFVITCELSLSSLGLLVTYKIKSGILKNWRFTYKMAVNLLQDSWPLAFSIVSIVIYQRIDQVMLQEMVGSREVGIYSVAVRMIDVWCFVPSAIYWSVFPSIVEAKKVSEVLFYEHLQKLYNLVALSGFMIAVPMTLFGPKLIALLFGPAFSGAGPMLVILTWANLFTSMEIARTAFLNAMNLNRIYFVAIFLGSVINIGLNYLLIPLYGGVGAATASLLAYWFAAHGSCFFFKKLFRTGRMMTSALVFPRVW